MQKIPFLDLSRYPESIKSKLKKKFEELLDLGVFSGGEEVAKFEAMLCTFTGSKFAIACANGTDALEIALRALHIGIGDKVLVPVLTWVSTVEVIKLVGAEPVLVPIDADGLIQIDDLKKYLDDNVKAIIPVHLYGNMVAMEKLINWADDNNIKVIEDGAQSLGSHISGKHAGTFGTIGCLSFYPTKNLGALGEAGAILTQDESLANEIRMLINHGQKERDYHHLIGKNARIDTLQVGFLTILFNYFPKWQEIRKLQAQKYTDAIANIADIKIVSNPKNTSYNVHLFVIRISKRDQLKHFLLEKGIETKIHYPHLLSHMIPYKVEGEFSFGEQFVKEILSLPLNPWLEESEQDKIIIALKAFFK